MRELGRPNERAGGCAPRAHRAVRAVTARRRRELSDDRRGAIARVPCGAQTLPSRPSRALQGTCAPACATDLDGVVAPHRRVPARWASLAFSDGGRTPTPCPPPRQDLLFVVLDVRRTQQEVTHLLDVLRSRCATIDESAADRLSEGLRPQHVARAVAPPVRASDSRRASSPRTRVRRARARPECAVCAIQAPFAPGFRAIRIDAPPCHVDGPGVAERCPRRD